MFKVDFTTHSLKDISTLDSVIAGRIIEKIDWLAENFDTAGKEALAGELKGKFKLRVGDWRIIYSFEYKTETITIYGIEHRRKVYKI